MRNLGPSSVEAIWFTRADGPRFQTIYQFCEGVESLIRAGAMDSVEGAQAQLFAAVDAAMEAGQRAWKARLDCSAARWR